MLRIFGGLLLALAFVLAGCGTGGIVDEEAAGSGEAQKLFTQKCGGCHTLEAAGTRGTIGPDLDGAFRTPRAEGFDETSIREIVLGQMRFPVPPMPKPDSPQMFPSGEWTGANRDAAMASIAAFVASVAGDKKASAAARAQGGAQASSDPKELFTGNCAGCHTLAAVGAKGTVGPNLDQLDVDVARAEHQIRRGGGGMPPFEGQLSDEQIKALAAFVASKGK